jgi:hypothetical protein
MFFSCAEVRSLTYTGSLDTLVSILVFLAQRARKSSRFAQQPRGVARSIECTSTDNGLH